MNKVSFSDMIRNKDLMSFNQDEKNFLQLCPDCDTKLTNNDLVDGYDTIVVCPCCGLRIYVG